MASWYGEHGYTVVARNWRRRSGEIDIVARRGSLTVVCEVKTRTSRDFGSPSEAVGPDKRRRLRRLAAEWLSENPSRGSLRFDVAEVVMTDGGSPELDIIESAF